MKGLVFDIETVDAFNAEKRKPEDLNISVVGVYHYPTDTYKAFTQEEFPALWEMLREVDTLIGFNSNHFDIPLLNKYAPVDLKKEFHSIDILEAVKETLGRRVKLDWIAEGTLGVTKSGYGLEAIEWWRQGEKEKVKKYCLDDVKITKDLFEHAKEKKELTYVDLGNKYTIPINTSSWEREVEVKDAYSSLF